MKKIPDEMQNKIPDVLKKFYAENSATIDATAESGDMLFAAVKWMCSSNDEANRS